MVSSKSSPNSLWGLRWRTYRSWPRSRRGLVLEAFCLLGICRFLIRYISFNLTASQLMGWFMAETLGTVEPDKAKTAADVGWIVERMAEHTPWESACLAQAMAAQNMLKRRGIGSTLYLGLNSPGRYQSEPEAHAWLRCGSAILTGESEMGDFQSVACYALDEFGAYRAPFWSGWFARRRENSNRSRATRPYLTPE